MQNPKPVHLMTDDELRELGWWAAERDSDGHLISMRTLSDDPEAIGEFFLTAAKDGNRAYTL